MSSHGCGISRVTNAPHREWNKRSELNRRRPFYRQGSSEQPSVLIFSVPKTTQRTPKPLSLLIDFSENANALIPILVLAWSLKDIGEHWAFGYTTDLTGPLPRPANPPRSVWPFIISIISIISIIHITSITSTIPVYAPVGSPTFCLELGLLLFIIHFRTSRGAQAEAPGVKFSRGVQSVDVIKCPSSSELENVSPHLHINFNIHHSPDMIFSSRRSCFPDFKSLVAKLIPVIRTCSKTTSSHPRGYLTRQTSFRGSP